MSILHCTHQAGFRREHPVTNSTRLLWAGATRLHLLALANDEGLMKLLLAGAFTVFLQGRKTKCMRVQ